MATLKQVASEAELRQGTPEWYLARMGKVTSSCFGKLMTKARSGGGMSQTALTYMNQLIAERMTGRPAEEIGSKYIDWGNEHEPTARQLYQWSMKGDHTLRQVGFVNHPTIDMVGGSPDCLIDDDGVMEIKCPYTAANHLKVIEGNVITDKDYKWQCQGNLWVTGRQWLDYVSFHPLFPEPMQLFVIRVPRDEDMIDELDEKVPRFLEQMAIRIKKIHAAMGVEASTSEQFDDEEG
ncbi:MAG: lambda exonuclease family protein [Planctomycetota bacterium]